MFVRPRSIILRPEIANFVRMKHNLSIYIILTLAVIVAGCSMNKTEAVLDDVESYIQERPDSALSVIRAIDTTTLCTPRLRAHYALLHAMALDKNWIDTTDVNVVMPAVEYYSRHKPGLYMAKALYYLGRIHFNGADYSEAIVSFIRAWAIAEQSDDIRLQSLICQAISDTYNCTYLFEEALPYSQEAYRLELLAKDSMLANATLYRIAQLKFNLSEYEEADSLYRHLISATPLHEQTRASILANYAHLLALYHKDFGKALCYYEESLSYGYGLPSYNHWGAYAYSLYHEGYSKRGKEVFTMMEKAGQGNEFAYEIWKSRAERFSGDATTAYDLLDDSFDKQTEGVMKTLRQSAIKAQRDYLSLQNDYLHGENRQRRIVNCLSITLLVSLLIIALLAIHYYRERLNRQNLNLIDTVQEVIALQGISDGMKERIQQMDEELSCLRESLDTRQKQLRGDHLRLTQDGFKELSDLCRAFYKNEGRPSQSNAVCTEVRRYMESLGIGNGRYSDLEKRVDGMFSQVMTHLRDEHPNHREKFYQIACYLFAGFKVRTIATLFHLDEKDIHQTKWRLKKDVETKETPHQHDFLTLLDG